MRYSWKSNLRYIGIALPFIAVFVVLLLYGYNVQETQVWSEKQREMGYIAELATDDLQIMLQEYIALTDEAAGVTVEANFATREEFVGYYQRFVAQNTAADAAYLALDNKVTYFDNWTAPEGYDPNIRAWYNQGKAGGGTTVFSDPYIDGITGNLVVSCLKKVTMPSGVVGVVGTDISLAGLKSLVDALHPSPNSVSYLLGPNDIIITHGDSDLLPKIVNDEEVYTKMSDLPVTTLETSKEHAGITKIIDYDGVEKYNCLISIPSISGWSLGLAIPVSDFEEDVDARISSLLPFVALGGIVAVFCVLLAAVLVRDSRKRSYWYESILDAIALPLSVTDNSMRWTFVNKPVEEMLGVRRGDVVGKQCSNWNAGICGTDACGIHCLRNGKNVTYFEQGGMNFKVNTSYLYNTQGKPIGHVEVVQDITELTERQKMQTEMVSRINEVANAFVTGSKQVASGAQALSQGSSEQAAAVQQLSASISEIARATSDNAGMADKAAKLAGTIKGSAEKGSVQMDEMMTAVKEINSASQQISKVIKVIDDIAFQTNILALNAAVEAARAGQYGKGFAVVAEEVRNLAAKSAEAAKDTGSLIANSMEKAGLGARIADETAASLGEIVSGINESTLLVGEIAKSSEQQSVGISQINEGVDQVARVVQQTSATAEESAAAANEMSENADMLDMLIAQFRRESESAERRSPTS